MKMTSGENKPTFWSKIRRYFISGILVTAPVVVTFYVVWIIIATIDTYVSNLLPKKFTFQHSEGFYIPGFGLIIAFLFLTFIGAIATGFLGRFFVKTSENFLNKMPIIRSLYSAIKQIFEAVLQREKASFREVVLLEYPRKGLWSLGFVSGTTKGEVQNNTGSEVINVFVPTTPNPTSGYLLFVPKEDLYYLEMTVEQGIKMVVSAGIITPPDPEDEV